MIPLAVLSKPAFRAPCNGCGHCCQSSLCFLAKRYLPGAAAPCPALEFEDGRTWCGLARHPSKHLGLKFNADKMLIPLIVNVVQASMGFGIGCSMEDFAGQAGEPDALELAMERPE